MLSTRKTQTLAERMRARKAVKEDTFKKNRYLEDDEDDLDSDSDSELEDSNDDNDFEVNIEDEALDAGFELEDLGDLEDFEDIDTVNIYHDDDNNSPMDSELEDSDEEENELEDSHDESEEDVDDEDQDLNEQEEAILEARIARNRRRLEQLRRNRLNKSSLVEDDDLDGEDHIDETPIEPASELESNPVEDTSSELEMGGEDITPVEVASELEVSPSDDEESMGGEDMSLEGSDENGSEEDVDTIIASETPEEDHYVEEPIQESFIKRNVVKESVNKSVRGMF